MTQAEYLNTAIREIMSRASLNRSTHPAKEAHQEFVASLAANRPLPMNAAPNDDDVTGRHDHVEKVLSAFKVYLVALLSDTAYWSGMSVDWRYFDAQYEDLTSETLGIFKNGAEELRQDEHRRAVR